KVYGANDPALTFKATGFVNEDDESIISGTLTRAAGEDVGAYAINQGTLSAGDNYSIEFTGADFNITTKTLTVMANPDQSKVYGANDPALTFKATGFVNEDDESIISGTLTRAAGEDVGVYAINQGTLSAGDNYSIEFTGDDFVITQKELAITAADITKTYGETINFVGTEFTVEGLEFKDEVSNLTLSSAGAVATAPIGTYPIVGSNAEGTGISNYNITYKDGQLNVGKKTLVITANNGSKIYGDSYSFNGTEFTVSGLVNKDVVTSASLTSTGAAATAGAGVYEIELYDAEGSGLYNYTLEYIKGSLEVNQKAITISADNKSKVYGEVNPTLTFTYSGLVNGDNSVSTSPTLTTEADSGSDIGTYAIQISGAADNNYDIAFENGTLEITPADLTIKADNKQKVYGEENPPLTFSFIGLVNGDTETTITASISTDAAANSAVGNYDINVSGATDSNYTISFENGNLEIIPAQLIVRAENKAKVYGDPNPELTFVYTGLVNGDLVSSQAPNITTIASEDSAVGSYPILVTGASDTNYDISFENGIMEVNPATLTIVANSDQSKIFGTEDPTLVFQASGFKLSDGLELIAGALEREKGEAVGKYAINSGTVKANDNYIVEFQGNEFEIIPAKIEAVISPADVETAWNIDPELPKTITVMTEDGRFLELEVIWDLTNLNILARGEYEINGTVVLPDGILNEESHKGSLIVKVMPKPAPSDVILSNNTFEGSATEFFIYVGGISVVDAFDDIHEISLKGAEGDNKYFEIIDRMLFWSSAEQVEGRDIFLVTVSVADRDGNISDKVFEVKRLRKSISDIEVFNSFTPNGDGVNDDWGIPDLRFYHGVTIRVFERSGFQVFVTNDPDLRWDGTYNGKELPVGTYYWVLEIQETGETRRGLLNLLRK
ncbi:MBG domain-containing protein, partial [Mongoliibacter ruber]